MNGGKEDRLTELVHLPSQRFQLFLKGHYCRVAHTHGNVRVDPESLVAVLDRRKSTFVSVDAVSRTRTECSRLPCEVQSWLRTD
jgi:hypothetical protein